MKRTMKSGCRIARLSVLVFCALITVSCMTTAGQKDKKSKEALDASVKGFNGDIRWQDYQGAAAFVAKSQRDRYWAEIEKLKSDTRVTDFEVRDVTFSDHDRLVRATVHYSYWRLDSPVLRTVDLIQRWQRLPGDKGMWTVSETGLKKLIGNSGEKTGQD